MSFESQMFVLLVIIVSITIFPFLGEKARIPAIVIELLIGMIFGMNGLIPIVQYEAGNWLDFLASLGFIFLMFLAGIEINIDKLKKFFKKSMILTIVIFSIGYVVGFGAGFLLMPLGLPPFGCLLMGTLFSCASIGIIFPIMKDLGVCNKTLGSVIIASTILLDIMGLALLSVLIGIYDAAGYAFIFDLILQIVIIIALFIGSIFLSRKAWDYADKKFSKTTVLEWEMRISVSLILIMAVAVTFINIEMIIGAFIAGLIMGESKYAEKELEGKIGAIGYGFLIPIFFFMIGVRTNIRAFFVPGSEYLVIITLIIIAISIGSRVLSGYIGAKLAKFSNKESIITGTSMIPRLSIGIAVAEIGLIAGIFNEAIFTIIIVTEFIMAFVSPLITNPLAEKLIPELVCLDKNALRIEHLRQEGIYIDVDEDDYELSDPFYGMNVKELMTENVITVNSNIMIKDFIILVEQTKHNTYPVLDDDRNLVGMFSMKDIEHAVNNEEFEVCVGESCKLDRKTLTPDDKLEHAFDIMIEDDVHSICITAPDDEKRLLGIVSKTDIMRALQYKFLKKDKI